MISKRRSRRDGTGVLDPAKVRTLVRQKLDEMARILTIDREQGPAAGLAAVRTDVGRDLMTEIRGTLRDGAQREQASVVKHVEDARDDGRISIAMDVLVSWSFCCLPAAPSCGSAESWRSWSRAGRPCASATRPSNPWSRFAPPA